MAGKYYVYGVAGDLDLSSAGNGLDADGTKLYCTTLAKNVADRAMQVGSGCCGGSRQHKTCPWPWHRSEWNEMHEGSFAGSCDELLRDSSLCR